MTLEAIFLRFQLPIEKNETTNKNKSIDKSLTLPIRIRIRPYQRVIQSTPSTKHYSGFTFRRSHTKLCPYSYLKRLFTGIQQRESDKAI